MSDQIEQMGVTIETQQKVCFIEKAIYVENIRRACLLFLLCLTCFLCFNQQLEDLQNKYVDQIRQCSDLSNKLDSTEVSYRFFCSISWNFICFIIWKWWWTTQKNLNKTSKLLANTEEELKKCHYTLKEKDFIISEQRKAGMLYTLSPFYHCFLCNVSLW